MAHLPPMSALQEFSANAQLQGGSSGHCPTLSNGPHNAILIDDEDSCVSVDDTFAHMRDVQAPALSDSFQHDPLPASVCGGQLEAIARLVESDLRTNALLACHGTTAVDVALSAAPTQCAEYNDDIIDHLLEREQSHTRGHGALHDHPEVTTRMRTILVDWLIDVAIKFKLHPESFSLAVDIVDRYIANAQVSRSVLQLIGVTAILIAAKHEEIWPPEIKECVYIAANTYSQEQVINTERSIAEALGFRFCVPTVYPFAMRALDVTTGLMAQEQLAREATPPPHYPPVPIQGLIADSSTLHSVIYRTMAARHRSAPHFQVPGDPRSTTWAVLAEDTRAAVMEKLNQDELRDRKFLTQMYLDCSALEHEVLQYLPSIVGSAAVLLANIAAWNAKHGGASANSTPGSGSTPDGTEDVITASGRRTKRDRAGRRRSANASGTTASAAQPATGVLVQGVLVGRIEATTLSNPNHPQHIAAWSVLWPDELRRVMQTDTADAMELLCSCAELVRVTATAALSPEAKQIAARRKYNNEKQAQVATRYKIPAQL